MIHFTNGDSVRGTLLRTGIPGDVVTCIDPLHEGPCLTGLSPAEFDRERAQYLASRAYAGLHDIERGIAERERALARAVHEDEVILWFEHDLFDQLNLLWLLDRLQRHAVRLERIRLIVIGSFPNVRPFHGLGQLNPGQLASLFPSRVPASEDQIAYALKVWTAVGTSTPEAIAELAQQRRTPLEFVPAALTRLLEELPGFDDGLSRTEREGLTAFRDGAATLGEAFRKQAEREEAVFLGDSSFFRTIDALSRGAVPLLSINAAEGGPPTDARAEDGAFAKQVASLTDAGRAVLDGRADHAALNGLDRWVGGVRLAGETPAWRWVPGAAAVVDARDARR